ncbi:MAG: ATP-binding cassette domain-containing protein, partial [Alphaproteobacteria bacterium]
MLDLYDIETGYGAGQVLFGVSLSVAAGACVSLMGRNGMGKTTTIRAIMGQLPLSAGRISRFGDDRSG